MSHVSTLLDSYLKLTSSHSMVVNSQVACSQEKQRLPPSVSVHFKIITMVVCSIYPPIGRLESLANIGICGDAFMTAWHVHSLTLTFKKLQKQFVFPGFGSAVRCSSQCDLSIKHTHFISILIPQIMSVYCLPNIPIIHVAEFFNKLRSRVS